MTAEKIVRALILASGAGAMLLSLSSCDNSTAENAENAKGELIAELMTDLQMQREQYEAVVKKMEAAVVSGGNSGAMRREEVLGLLSTLLHELPENAVVKLTRVDAGSHQISDLTIENLESVNIRARAVPVKSLQLSTVKRSNTQLDIVLKLYDGPLDEGLKPIEEMTLLRNVFRFEWFAMDGQTAEWKETWEEDSRVPLWIELNALFSERDAAVIHYFGFPHELSARG